MVAGPNGSGKSTLAAWLVRDYAVNFYTMLNADEVFAEVSRTGACFVPFPVDAASLLAYVEKSQYAEDEMRYLASYAEGEGFALQSLESTMPRWFKAVLKTSE
jgi:predicted ABC-type ATPase